MRRALTDNRRQLHKDTHRWRRIRYRYLIAGRIHAELYRRQRSGATPVTV